VKEVLLATVFPSRRFVHASCSHISRQHGNNVEHATLIVGTAAPNGNVDFAAQQPWSTIFIGHVGNGGHSNATQIMVFYL
jgi:hypothetical protein